MTIEFEMVVAGRTARERRSERVARPAQDGVRPLERVARQSLMRGILETCVVPRLSAAHPGGRACPFGRVCALPTAADAEAEACAADTVAALSRLMLAGDRDAAAAFVDAAQLGGADLARLYPNLIGGALKLAGVLWEEDRASFVEVTLAGGVALQLMRDFAPRFQADAPVGDPRRRALVTTLPGEQHVVGAQMAAEFLRRAGWETEVETPAAGEPLGGRARREWFAVVGLSIARAERLYEAAAAVRDLRRRSRNVTIGVMVGGAAFAGRLDAAASSGADGWPHDAADAAVTAERMLSRG